MPIKKLFVCDFCDNETVAPTENWSKLALADNSLTTRLTSVAFSNSPLGTVGEVQILCNVCRDFLIQRKETKRALPLFLQHKQPKLLAKGFIRTHAMPDMDRYARKKDDSILLLSHISSNWMHNNGATTIAQGTTLDELNAYLKDLK